MFCLSFTRNRVGVTAGSEINQIPNSSIQTPKNSRFGNSSLVRCLADFFGHWNFGIWRFLQVSFVRAPASSWKAKSNAAAASMTAEKTRRRLTMARGLWVGGSAGLKPGSTCSSNARN